MTSLLLIALAGAAIHYLSYHALITHWLWSRYPLALDGLLSCAACSGTWVGLGLAYPLAEGGYPLLGLRELSASYFLLAAAAGMVLVPIVSALQLLAMRSMSAPTIETVGADQDQS
jgi:hypothetical protein